MAKLDVSSFMNKVKSALDNITGPGHSAATEEALAMEKDPTKAKLLEVELLISQMQDLVVMQNKTISELKNKYVEVKNLTTSLLNPPVNPPVNPQVNPTVNPPVDTSAAQSSNPTLPIAATTVAPHSTPTAENTVPPEKSEDKNQ